MFDGRNVGNCSETGLVVRWHRLSLGGIGVESPASKVPSASVGEMVFFIFGQLGFYFRILLGCHFVRSFLVVFAHKSMCNVLSLSFIF